MTDSAAGAASLIKDAAPLPFLPAPLPAAFFTLFLLGLALLAGLRETFFSAFLPAGFTAFFSTLSGDLWPSRPSFELSSFTCNCARNSIVRCNSFSNFSSPNLRRDFLITFLTRPTRLLLPFNSLSRLFLAFNSLSFVSLSFVSFKWGVLSFVFVISVPLKHAIILAVCLLWHRTPPPRSEFVPDAFRCV